MTKIEWCDITLSPVVGCSKCSPGCLNCYAERFAARMVKNPKTAAKYADVVDNKGHWTSKLSYGDYSCFNKLPQKPCRVFVGSMRDVFHENANPNDLTDLLDIISEDYPEHIFLFLTKRIENADKIIPAREILPDNIWLGVTVCNQEEADAKIPVLLQIPVEKRFVSVEPMLGPIDLEKYLISCDGCGNQTSTALCLNRPGSAHDLCNACDKYGHESSPFLNWVICGGETGPGARPMHPDWARSLRDQCNNAAVPFFFKQMSGRQETPEDLKVRQFPE